jgi:hypothetical protein
MVIRRRVNLCRHCRNFYSFPVFGAMICASDIGKVSIHRTNREKFEMMDVPNGCELLAEYKMTDWNGDEEDI